MNQVSKSFESDFLSEALVQQIDACDRNELVPLLLRVFAESQPVLEAGCGSGRWCGWFLRRGIACDGVDWSQELCDRAAREFPQARFFACDMASVPVPDGSYGGIIAFGSIEHTQDGPQAILREFRRLLWPGGRALITVPFGSPLRRLASPFANLSLTVKAIPQLRRLFGKRVGPTRLANARKGPRHDWLPFVSNDEQGWFFYEYRFTRSQMRSFLAEAGLAVREEFVGFHDEGILHHFGRLAGRFDRQRGAVDFTPVGRLLRAVLPVGIAGHMLCYLVERDD